MKVPKEGGKVRLTEAELSLPTNKLRTLLSSRGLKVSRATLSRLRHSGWFLAHGDRGVGRHAPHGFVRLTETEKLMRPRELAELFGIWEGTAGRAKRRGWFEVMSNNLDGLTPEARKRIEHGDLPPDASKASR